jgi:hypothetical protein
MSTSPQPTRAVRELSQIPFGTLIGQPLKATVEAQALAAKTTVDFIQKVGFVPPDRNQDPLFADEEQDADGGRVRNVTFAYTKRDENDVDSSFTLTVPILSIVPIPVLRIDEVTIDFTAKLTDAVENTTKQNFQLGAETAGSFKSFWSPVSLDVRASMSLEKSQSSASRYTREYTMAIHVRAVQDDMPAGLARVLGILETAISERKTQEP